MKLSLVLLLAMAAIVYARPEEKYTEKFDNVDVDEILRSDRLTENYVNCLLDKKPCTPDGTELKNNIDDALKTKCSKCSEKQKSASKKVLRHLYRNKRTWWTKLEAKYDPEGTYVKDNEEELKKL